MFTMVHLSPEPSWQAGNITAWKGVLSYGESVHSRGDASDKGAFTLPINWLRIVRYIL